MFNVSSKWILELRASKKSVNESCFLIIFELTRLGDPLEPIDVFIVGGIAHCERRFKVEIRQRAGQVRLFRGETGSLTQLLVRIPVSRGFPGLVCRDQMGRQVRRAEQNACASRRLLARGFVELLRTT